MSGILRRILREWAGIIDTRRNPYGAENWVYDGGIENIYFGEAGEEAEQTYNAAALNLVRRQTDYFDLECIPWEFRLGRDSRGRYFKWEAWQAD